MIESCLGSYRTRLTRCRFIFMKGHFRAKKCKNNDMQAEIILSPLLYPGRELREAEITVAVDVLRATSAICAAFFAGAERIVPLASLAPLEEYHKAGYLIAAERNGKKLGLATCGNSPTEYLRQDLRGARLAYSTTNGTVSITTAGDAKCLYVGAFANITTLAEATKDAESILILCSGWKGEPSLEDTLFAGALLDKIAQYGREIETVNDAATAAGDLWATARGDVYKYCEKATHVRRLKRLGAEADIQWSFEQDTTPGILPRYNKEHKWLEIK